MASRQTLHHRQRLLGQGRALLGGWLDPIDRLSETIFSILIVLTFTLAFRILRLSDGADAALWPSNVNELALGAVGAVFAWGLIDGVMYALLSLFGRGERHRLLRDLHSAGSEDEAVELIADDLDYLLEPISSEADRLALYRSIQLQLRESQPRPVAFKTEDVTGALGHIIVALVAVTPSLIPLVAFPSRPDLAIRLSNVVSFIMLFVTGYRWGQYSGAVPWKTGLTLAGVAGVMVLIAILLGG